MFVELQFSLELKWYDHYVKWVNLKEDNAKNVLLESEISKLWMPKLMFQNSDNILPIPFDAASVVAVEKEQEGKTESFPEELNRALYFNSIANPITYSHKFQNK